jgi:hypothetical protein
MSPLFENISTHDDNSYDWPWPHKNNCFLYKSIDDKVSTAFI